MHSSHYPGARKIASDGHSVYYGDFGSRNGGGVADGQEQKVGGKVTCGTCGTTVVIVKAPGDASPIVCCGAPIGSASGAKEAANG